MPERPAFTGRTSIEEIRRRDLVEAAFLTFLDHGLSGMTIARIGQRAGMSHGIVNYYFKSKDQLLSAVIRHAFGLIERESLERLHGAKAPRERIMAIVIGNFPERLFNRETAAAWASFYGSIPTNPDFERLQDAFYRRLRSNLVYYLKQLVRPADAERIALGISVWIDGLWLRSAMKQQWIGREAALQAIEGYIDAALVQASGSVAGKAGRTAARGPDNRAGRSGHRAAQLRSRPRGAR